MATTASLQKNHRIGGVAFSQTVSISANAQILHDVSVPAAEDGALSTRTNNTDGTITMDDSGHSIGTGDRIDLYWTGGSRRAVTVGTVSGASVPISGGLGDNLPTQATEVSVAPTVALDVVVTGANVVMMAVVLAAAGKAVFEDAGGEELYVPLVSGEVWDWSTSSGTTNPITGDSIVKVYLSQSGASAVNGKVGLAYNNA
jgi:hypothetical protein